MIGTLTALVILQSANTLTAAEKRAGWELLFDGKSTKGWHNFKKTGVTSGWVVKDGVLTCADPEKAGDIVSDKKYKWFDMTVEVNLGVGQNSGIMFHVADSGAATWHTGPEIQLYDHKQQAGVQTTGFLYELYTSDVDAAKPAGQWNKLRILVSKEKCLTEVNGVKYYEYVLGSPEFKARIAKSKFSKYPNFGTLGEGYIAIQGDHGVVSFRNMKIRPL